MLAARLLGTRNEGGPVSSYLLIESRDPFESNDVPYYYELAKALREAGNEVTLFLVQNGVLAARPSAPAATLSALGQSGVKVLADEFSLRERGIARLAEGIAAAAIDVVVDHLEAGSRTLWH
jgi:sulfur relay (sulfurtransferase) complex TusBCD TusD component (DsrE family)